MSYLEKFKVIVNNKSEEDEVIKLCSMLGLEKANWDGFDFPKFISNNYRGRLSDYLIDISPTVSSYKTLNIQQLKDMVVLKRNSIDDASAYCHENEDHYYISSEGEYFFYLIGDESSKWVHSSNDISYLKKYAKPIKKEMKEYLEPMPNGDYRYHKDEGFCVGGDWIEIPEDADAYIRRHQERSPHFRKSIDDKHFLFCIDGHWNESWCHPHEIAEILWQRPKDKDTTNTSHSTSSIPVWVGVDLSRCVDVGISNITEVGINHEGLYQKKVDWFSKFLKGKSVQYRVGKGVGSDTSQWNNLTWESIKNMKHYTIEFREKPKHVTVDGIVFETEESLLKYVRKNFNLEGGV